MQLVNKNLEYYSKLTPEELNWEIPGVQFTGIEEGVLRFKTAEPDAILTFIEKLGTLKLTSKIGYQYTDGSTAKFIKSRMWFEIKKHKKVIGTILLE